MAGPCTTASANAEPSAPLGLNASLPSHIQGRRKHGNKVAAEPRSPAKFEGRRMAAETSVDAGGDNAAPEGTPASSARYPESISTADASEEPVLQGLSSPRSGVSAASSEARCSWHSCEQRGPDHAGDEGAATAKRWAFVRSNAGDGGDFVWVRAGRGLIRGAPRQPLPKQRTPLSRHAPLFVPKALQRPSPQEHASNKRRGPNKMPAPTELRGKIGSPNKAPKPVATFQ